MNCITACVKCITACVNCITACVMCTTACENCTTTSAIILPHVRIMLLHAECTSDGHVNVNARQLHVLVVILMVECLLERSGNCILDVRHAA